MTLYIRIYIYVCVCMYVCMYVCMHVCIYACRINISKLTTALTVASMVAAAAMCAKARQRPPDLHLQFLCVWHSTVGVQLFAGALRNRCYDLDTGGGVEDPCGGMASCDRHAVSRLNHPSQAHHGCCRRAVI